MKRNKALVGTAVLAVGALSLSACGGSSDDGGSSADGGEVNLVLWQNSTTGDGVQYWEDMATAFNEANPNVTVEVVSIQNEDMDGKLQTALNSGDAPDVFMARGGGKLADVVEAGQVMDLTDKLSDDIISVMGTSMSAFEVDGKYYGVPTAVLPEGFFYSEDLFAAAGVTETPTTLDELSEAVTKLQDSGVEAIAVGAQDAWPAAH